MSVLQSFSFQYYRFSELVLFHFISLLFVVFRFVLFVSFRFTMLKLFRFVFHFVCVLLFRFVSFRFVFFVSFCFVLVFRCTSFVCIGSIGLRTTRDIAKALLRPPTEIKTKNHSKCKLIVIVLLCSRIGFICFLFSPSVFQSFSLSALQSFILWTFPSFRLLQFFILSVFQSFSLSICQSFSLSVSQYYRFSELVLFRFISLLFVVFRFVLFVSFRFNMLELCCFVFCPVFVFCSFRFGLFCFGFSLHVFCLYRLHPTGAPSHRGPIPPGPHHKLLQCKLSQTIVRSRGSLPHHTLLFFPSLSFKPN